MLSSCSPFHKGLKKNYFLLFHQLLLVTCFLRFHVFYSFFHFILSAWWQDSCLLPASLPQGFWYRLNSGRKATLPPQTSFSPGLWTRHFVISGLDYFKSSMNKNWQNWRRVKLPSPNEQNFIIIEVLICRATKLNGKVCICIYCTDALNP